MNLTNIDPCLDGIRPHACIRHFPKWNPDGPKATALRMSIQTSGIIQPVQMTAQHEILDPDSRERWLAARALQLETIPAMIVPDEMSFHAFISAFFHRNHLTLGARAYLVVQAHPNLATEAHRRRLKNLAKTPYFLEGNSVLFERSTASVAEVLKVSKKTIQKAIELTRLFDKHAERQFEFEVNGGAKDGDTVKKTLREHFEPLLLEEEEGDEHHENRMGLGAIIKAIGYLVSPSRETPTYQPELNLFGKSIETFCVRACRMEDEGEARKKIREALDKIGDADELQQVCNMAAILNSEARARAKEIQTQA